MKYDVFISYRRDGGEYTARILRDKLTEQGYSVFFDVESLRSGDFNAELYNVIENCSDFVLILSPNALDRCANDGDWVKNEIEHAINTNRNIVPVLLRGFEFPDNLPDSISALPKYNGIEANSQFFDAFITKLQQFLVSKPPFTRRIKQNPLFKKTLPLLVAFALVISLFFGITTFVDRINAVYPRTTSEKNITDAVSLSVLSDFTQMNIAADYSYQLIDRAENYILTSENNFSAFRSDYNAICNGIEQSKANISPVSQELIQQLYDTPFSPADVESLNEQTSYFCDEWLDTAKFIKHLVSDDCYISDSEKLQVIDCYRSILDNSLQFYADCYGNGILSTVVDSEYLNENLFYQNAAYLEHIPFDWTDDEEQLLNRINHSLNSIETATQKYSLIVGSENSENAELKQNMVTTYMLLGYSLEQAQQKVEEYQQKVDKILADTEEIRQLCLPSEQDTIDMLWYKMSHLLAIDCTDDARDCADMFYSKIAGTDKYADTYIPAVKRFIDEIEDGVPLYGVMVTGYISDNNVHPQLKIGDLITAFDGQPCFSYEQYVTYKQQLALSEYTLTVLRISEDNSINSVELELTADMPKIALSTLVYHDSMLQQ